MDHEREVAHRVAQHSALEGGGVLAHQVASEEAAVGAANHRYTLRVSKACMRQGAGGRGGSDEVLEQGGCMRGSGHLGPSLGRAVNGKQPAFNGECSTVQEWVAVGQHRETGRRTHTRHAQHSFACC